MTRLLLIRHGESVAQQESFIAGHEGCRGLSERGRRQVEVLRDRLAATGELHADVFLTSKMRRAIETAAILSPAVGGSAAIEQCDFCEIHPGETDGLTWAEFEARYRPDSWTWSPDEPVGPGGESWSGFVGRVGRAIDEVTTAHAGKTIVIACHGGIVRASLLHFLPFGVDSGELAMVFNASVTEWRFPDEPLYDRSLRWRLCRFNDHAHLAGTDLLVES
ncbi:MAG: histidine phosphatase family protein [Acidobacteria bacterium]|nr:histidine phosphatase family protein [Acidobacteriota bacterium]